MISASSSSLRSRAAADAPPATPPTINTRLGIRSSVRSRHCSAPATDDGTLHFATRRVKTRPGLRAGWAGAGVGVGPKPNRRRCDRPASVVYAFHRLREEAHMRVRSPARRPVHSHAALRSGGGAGIRQRPRRYPRFTVSWPVVVETGKRLFLLQAVDVSG